MHLIKWRIAQACEDLQIVLESQSQNVNLCSLFCLTLYYILTFGPFDQLDIHDSLSDAPPASYTQPDQTSCLLQCLHSPAVGHLPDICVINSNYTVIHPAQKKITHIKTGHLTCTRKKSCEEM